MPHEVTLFFKTQKHAEEFAVQAALANQAAAKPLDLYVAVAKFSAIRLGDGTGATKPKPAKRKR